MARRRGRPVVAPPEQLCRFVWSEWPGYEHEAEAWSVYMGARFGWMLDHPGESLPTDAREAELFRRAHGYDPPAWESLP